MAFRKKLVNIIEDFSVARFMDGKPNFKFKAILVGTMDLNILFVFLPLKNKDLSKAITHFVARLFIVADGHSIL